MATRDWFWILLLGGIWGFSFIFNAILIRELGPLWVSALRVCIGALGCWVALFVMRKPLPRDPILWIRLGALGWLAYSIPFALYPLAQGSLASGVAAIINALTPNSQLWAIGACLGATVCYALSLNITRSFKSVEPTAFAVVAMSGAGLSSAILAFSFEGAPVITLPETWLAALGIGLVATTFTFIIMYRILPRVGATNFSTVTFIAPVSAIIFGFLLLGEIIQPIHLIGMVAIFIGLLMIDGRLPRWIGMRSRAAH